MIYLSLTTILERINNFVNFYKNFTTKVAKQKFLNILNNF